MPRGFRVFAPATRELGAAFRPMSASGDMTSLQIGNQVACYPISPVPGESSSVYRFGDLLALVREYWVREMIDELARAGFTDYRRNDASLVRLLMRGPRSVGRIGAAL